MQGDIQEFLNQKTWAVVGVSLDPTKYGNKVYFQLKKAGYTVYPINPNLDSIDGDPCYPNLGSLPIVPDAINTVVPPKVTEQIVEDCVKLGISRIWMQPGSESEKAIQIAHDHGLKVVHNQCVLIQTRDKVKN